MVMETWTIVGYLVLATILLFITGCVIAWLVSSYRDSKLSKVPPPLETEPWVYQGKELYILYKKDGRPAQSVIDSVTGHIDRYHSMVMDRIGTTGEYKEDTRGGIVVESISFPASDDEGDYDFSINYDLADDPDTFLCAYFKDGKVQSLSVGD